MENRMVKFYSKESNLLAMHAIPGHFATSHSHINYYVDVTSLKTRAGEAKEAVYDFDAFGGWAWCNFVVDGMGM